MKKSLHPVGLAVVTLLIGVTTGGAHAQVAEPSALTSATRAAPFVQPSSATAANGIKLINLTAQGATVAAGDKACPSQPYYLYSGGKPDNFAGPADLAFPSPNLVAFIPANGPTVTYDTPMSDGRFGDSFNLQNTRGICYAVIEFKAKSTNGGSPNDGLTMGHVVGSNGSPFDVVAQIINPGAVGVGPVPARRHDARLLPHVYLVRSLTRLTQPAVGCLRSRLVGASTRRRRSRCWTCTCKTTRCSTSSACISGTPRLAVALAAPVPADMAIGCRRHAPAA